jgi:hypothetical protein
MLTSNLARCLKSEGLDQAEGDEGHGDHDGDYFEFSSDLHRACAHVGIFYSPERAGETLVFRTKAF